MDQKYTGVKFYFRDINRWGNFLKLNAGFDGNFVQDKTTDSANISFIVQDEPDFFTINTWAALFINADSPELEFNVDGTPKNHEQFIVGGYQYYKTLAGYQVSMKLVEPIERFRGVLGETLSYTNQTSKVQDGTTYVKDPYNYYTALKRWLQVTPANTDNISRDSEEKDPNGIAWWNRITILDKDFLSSLSFADDTLNELTLYDLLLDVYDSGTGRTPVAYFDLNTETGMPKRLDRDEYLLKFIRQDGTDKPVLEWDDLTANKGYGEVCTGVMNREDGANYATGLVSNITNLSPDTTVTFPAEGLYAVPQVLQDIRNTTSYGDPIVTYYNGGGDSKWGIVLPHKIKRVIKIEEIKMDGFITYADNVNPESYSIIRDVFRRPVLERKELLLNGDSSFEYYDEGDNIIYLQDYYFKEQKSGNVGHPGLMDSRFYYIEYEPLIDARVCLGDTEYVRQINQTASQVDSDKFGKFMQSYLAGMDKSDYTIQRTTEKPQDYINLIGSIVMRGEREYLITNVAFRNRNYQYDIFFQLNENHMRKNMSYLAPQNIRANTAIQYNNIKNRQTTLKDKFKFGLKPVNNTSSIDKRVLLNIFGLKIEDTYYPQIANIVNYYKDQDPIAISANIAPFVIGNMIGFNVILSNNAISGKRKYLQADGNTYNAGAHSPFTRVVEQVPTIYTDAFGEVDKTTIIIGSASVNKLKSVNLSNDASDEKHRIEFQKSVEFQNNMLNAFATPVNLDKEVIKIEKINLQKDMLEEYNITYGLEIEGEDGITFNPEIFKFMRILNPKFVVPDQEVSEVYIRPFVDGYDMSPLRLHIKFEENYMDLGITYGNLGMYPGSNSSISLKATFEYDDYEETSCDILTIKPKNFNPSDQIIIYY